MFSLGFGRKKAPLLGLDIGSTAVKLIELSQAGAGSAHTYQVESCALEPLPPGAIAERKIADPQLVGEAIRKAVARSGSRAKAAAVAMPGAAAITKVITLPAGLVDEEMENQITMDADQYIPYPLEEVDIDFTVLGPAVTPGEVDVLLAAARHEIAINLIIALEIAGLKASIIDVEPYALENACILALGAQGQGQTIAIADIGADAMRIQVMRQGRTLFTREQGFAAAQLFEEVQHRYDLTPEEARRRVIEKDLPASFASEVRDPFSAALAQQIGRALQFFYSSTASRSADQILLAGGVAGLPGLDRVIGESLGITAYIANPFIHMTLGPKVGIQLIHRQGPALAVAVGLALRGFD
ncbi:MAG: pilus assembly protein PilM [Chromatiaceae bacterium]|nr:pilus assembly protein PilM [Chromatiaceae bacterium]